ncbi:RND transporter [Ralstonia sp. A12]|uniref:efflux transporter outer membrane subunit n=1 Tax=Ralstonia sp. A12 TaxID=1217052 RepID=UPI000573438E|nr:efflux transporter outer membrane subunit [Ralstonia sp. A12]KHK58285.1 RND transporter [Ralstonia sp. A12]
MKAVCRAACLAAIVLAAGGCAVGPDFREPAAPNVDRYLHDGDPAGSILVDGVAQKFTAAPVSSNWWHAFGSPTLDNVMESAITANPTLQQAEANLRAAQDLLRAGAGVFYPQVTASADVSRQAVVPARLGQMGAPSLFTLWTLGPSISYALDIFGGSRRTVESLAAQAEGQRYAVAAAYLTLTGNLVNAVIARAAYTAQIDTTRSLIAVVHEQVDIAHAQVDAGVMAHSSELSLITQLAALEASLPPLEQKRDQAAHLEAVLMGRFPAQAETKNVGLSSLGLPADLPSLVPSELVRQRPDVLAAQARLHQATADVGVATAAMLPSLTLSADYARMGNRSADLFGAQAGAWSIGASLFAPLFEGGTLYYRRGAAKQALQAADADYRQVVLASFQQVADVLRALEHDAIQLDAQLREQAAASAALDEINAGYRAGVASYLQVLSADLQYQQAVLGTVQVRAQRLQDTVALFLALGGGWRGAALAGRAEPPG